LKIQDGGRTRYLGNGLPIPAIFGAVPNFAAIGQTVAEIWRFFHFFQYGNRPPSWICFAVWTIHEEYLVVFIVVQNLVGIGAVLLIICVILNFAVWLENAYSQPQNWRFGGYDPFGRHINETSSPKGYDI